MYTHAKVVVVCVCVCVCEREREREKEREIRLVYSKYLLVTQMVKAGKLSLQYKRPGFNPWVGKICWRREWQPIPAFLPGKSLE